MESIGHTCTHIYIPKPAMDAFKKCAFDTVLTISPLLNISQVRCQVYGLHLRQRAHFLEDLLTALRLSGISMLLKLEESGVVGKTKLQKCVGCDGSLDTLPPPNRAKKGIFHFHEIM